MVGNSSVNYGSSKNEPYCLKTYPMQWNNEITQGLSVKIPDLGRIKGK